MRLSDLQKHILVKTCKNGPQLSRSVFNKFYKKPGDQQGKIITVSIERLIAKGLVKGFGYKTAEKLFIQKVSLTPKGKKIAIKIITDSQRLPLKKR